jgi:hypothetical protein
MIIRIPFLFMLAISFFWVFRGIEKNSGCKKRKEQSETLAPASCPHATANPKRYGAKNLGGFQPYHKREEVM